VNQADHAANSCMINQNDWVPKAPHSGWMVGNSECMVRRFVASEMYQMKNCLTKINADGV
jgi:oligoribonuclease (3'-5' exoribonuclease)